MSVMFRLLVRMGLIRVLGKRVLPAIVVFDAVRAIRGMRRKDEHRPSKRR
jgi:hypothetical protein